MQQLRQDSGQSKRLHKFERQQQVIVEMTAEAFRSLEDEVDKVLIELHDIRDGYREQITRRSRCWTKDSVAGIV